MHWISDGETAQDVDRRLWLELTPEKYRRVRGWIRRESEEPIRGLLGETNRVIEGLASHFPEFGPAIRAVAHHVIEDGPENGEPCCDGARRA